MENLVGIVCGKCKKETLYLKSCPIHHWTVSSYCSNCGEFYKVADTCKECNFPKEGV